MAEFLNNTLSIAFDSNGCPQRCKHCWIGHPRHRKMNARECMDIFEKIRDEQDSEQYYGAKIEYFMPEFREYHYSDDYRELYDETDRINGCRLDIKERFELLSIWRLCRDEKYVKWAVQRGYRKSQIKIFGMEKTNDLFYGRRGAHKDIIKANRILIDNGISPRWQIYYNEPGLEELNEVMGLAEKLCIRDIHAMTFVLDGAGFSNARFCLQSGDEKKIPSRLWKKSRTFFKNNYELLPEPEWADRILKEKDEKFLPQGYDWLWFFVTSDWNVYPNFFNIAPYWKLGNLREDAWQTILKAYAEDRAIGLQVLKNETSHSLVKRCSDPNSRKLFMSGRDLLYYYAGKRCREIYFSKIY